MPSVSTELRAGVQAESHPEYPKGIGVSGELLAECRERCRPPAFANRARRFVEIRRRHGVFLMVDEAHSLGVLGETGRGIREQCGVPSSEVDLWMGTMSKTLAGCGGFIAGCQPLIDMLRHLASVVLTADGILHARQGRTLGPADLASSPARLAAGRLSAAGTAEEESRADELRATAEEWVRLLGPAGELMGLARPAADDRIGPVLLHPSVVLI